MVTCTVIDGYSHVRLSEFGIHLVGQIRLVHNGWDSLTILRPREVYTSLLDFTVTFEKILKNIRTKAYPIILLI